MTTQKTISVFTKGTHNVLDDEVIPADAASDSMAWLTRDGVIELVRGRSVYGNAGSSGKVYGEHTGYRVDGVQVRFRKVGTKIQYYNGGTWTDIITGLTAADYTFANYSSLAGAFVYAFGPDGLYKIATANPGSFTSLYDAAKNFKGYAIIDKGRTILWGRKEDPTGLYGSYIDAQDSTVYTTVSGEATTSLTGTLAFKAGGAARTAFGVVITLTGSGEVYRDNFSGVLTGSLGGTGTINYTTGAYTISNAGVGTATYQWENSNVKGITDFTKSATRLAGEGFVIRQDVGGDAIKVVIPFDGSYFSLKERSCYNLTIDAEDENPFNEIFRTDIGVSSLRSAVGTSLGIVFINTANPSRPNLQILGRNTLGDNFKVTQLFPHFAFQNYTYEDALVDSWDEYIIVGCRESSQDNNRLLLCNIRNETVDETYYDARASTKLNGSLHVGSSVAETTYVLFEGFDDLGTSITNFWESRGELFDSPILKKEKKLRFKGKITPDQAVEVYMSLDDNDYQLVGTILGSGSYVDYGVTYAIGTSIVGTQTVGGGILVNVYPYYMEMKIRVTKFRKRKIKFVATGIGYASIEQITDFDIWTYADKIPAKYRQKQNVGLAGTPTDLPTPDY